MTVVVYTGGAIVTVTDTALPVVVNPSIVGFSATPGTITAGQSTVLNATVANAVSLTLDGSPVTLPVTVTPTADHSYTLVATGAPGSTPATALAGVVVNSVVVPPTGTPAWRAAMPVKDVWYQIAGTANMSGCYQPPLFNEYYLVDGWIGFAASNNAWYVPASGGHATALGQNGVQKIDFSQNAPVWTVDYVGTPNPPPMTTAGSLTRTYYADGNPCSRHSYYANWYVPQRNSVFMFYDAANYDGTSAAYDTVDRYDCVTKNWDANGINPATGLIWPKSGCYTGSAIRVPSCCMNPTTGDVYLGTAYNILRKWTQATATWSDLPFWLPEYPNQFRPDWSYSPSLIDVARNRIVVANQANKKFEYVDLGGGNIARSPATTIDMYEAGMVHDLDNDRYVLVDRSGNVYAINPTTWAVSQLPFSAPSYTQNGVFTRLTYFKDFGGIAYASRYSANIQFLPTR